MFVRLEKIGLVAALTGASELPPLIEKCPLLVSMPELHSPHLLALISVVGPIVLLRAMALAISWDAVFLCMKRLDSLMEAV
jgi:hypothetical protein